MPAPGWRRIRQVKAPGPLSEQAEFPARCREAARIRARAAREGACVGAKAARGRAPFARVLLPSGAASMVSRRDPGIRVRPPLSGEVSASDVAPRSDRACGFAER